MDKTHQIILNDYKLRLRHYYEMGIGNKSQITGATITLKMIVTCLERYMELGGDEHFMDIKDEEYREFLEEMSMLQC